MRHVLLAGLAACGFAMGAAPASAQGYVPQAVKKSVNLDDLKAVVGSFEGHAVEEDHVFDDGSDKDVSLRAHDKDGLKYILVGTACDTAGVTGCQGVMMQVRYEQKSIDYKQLAKANYDNAATSVWFDQDSETLGVTRYVVLDYGITMQNLRENLNVLLDVVGNVIDEATASESAK